MLITATLFPGLPYEQDYYYVHKSVYLEYDKKVWFLF